MLRKKNTSSDNEDTQLMDVFSAHFGEVLNLLEAAKASCLYVVCVKYYPSENLF